MSINYREDKPVDIRKDFLLLYHQCKNIFHRQSDEALVSHWVVYNMSIASEMEQGIRTRKHSMKQQM